MIILVLAIWGAYTSTAQDDKAFTMKLSSDSVLMGNTFQLNYSIENIDGEFVAPDLSDFRVVSGPNVSSQFSSVNGKVTQKRSYSYHLLPLQPGVGHVGKATISDNGEDMTLEGVDIVIIENPHDIQDTYGKSFSRSNQIRKDTLSIKQKELLEKLKTGKRRKI